MQVEAAAGAGASILGDIARASLGAAADSTHAASGAATFVRELLPSRPGYFRTFDQLQAAMHDLAARHPDLVRLEQVGASGETTRGMAQRPIWMLRITAPAPAAAGPTAAHAPTAVPRPRVLHVSGMHPREIANPELVMRHVEQLVRGYGTDADATHILDTTEVLAIPVMNPDGHAVVERGFELADVGDPAAGHMIWNRKNTSLPDGVDQNRNFDHAFGLVGGSADPFSRNYRGDHAASESEVQALQGVLQRERPDVYADWHSPGETVFIPWGDSATPSPRDAGLRLIAGQMGRSNGYSVLASHEKWPDSGTSKDFAHALLDIPAFTVETGAGNTAYHQTDAQFADTWARNAGVFSYLDRLAGDSWSRGAGPVVEGARISGGLLVGGTAFGAGGAAAGHAVAGAELVRDPAASPGSGLQLAVDGVGHLTGDVSSAASSGARELAYVRALGTDGAWGPLTAAWLN